MQYVVLGGDDEIIPIRSIYVTYAGYATWMPVDLYYGGLDGDWDAEARLQLTERGADSTFHMGLCVVFSPENLLTIPRSPSLEEDRRRQHQDVHLLLKSLARKERVRQRQATPRMSPQSPKASREWMMFLVWPRCRSVS